MNFRDRYRQEMNRSTPSPESTQQLQAALQAAKRPKASQLRRLQWGLGTAALSCAALIAVVALWQPWNRPVPAPLIADASVATSTSPQLQTGGANYKNVIAVYKRLAQEEKAYDEQMRRDLKGSAATKENAVTESTGSEAAPQISDPLFSQDTAARPTAQSALPDYSNTNIQVEGVQEADIVKTDGRYLYALGSTGLRIINPNNGHPRLLGTLSSESDANAFFDLYVTGDRLIGLRRGYLAPVNTEGNVRSDSGPLRQSKPNAPTSAPQCSLADVVTAVIFDVSDPAHPRRLNSISQSGSYVSSRMIDTKLYLVTTDYPDPSPLYYGNKRSSWTAPRVYSSTDRIVPFTAENGSPTLLDPNEISIYPTARDTNYAVACALETAGDGSLLSRRSILGGGSMVYASLDNLYVIGVDYLEQRSKITDASMITRIALDDGRLSVKATTRVPGCVDDQFSLDESAGVLRVVTNVTGYRRQSHGWLEPTGSQTVTNVYCLDSDLRVTGKIEDIAPDERVYSCRYVGDYAYFVTFRTMDPLFTADLSDPGHPRLVGALKIPGFSEYLHPWSKTELFGLGSTVVAGHDGGVRQDSLKIAMFDTSDPTNVKVKHEITIPGKYYSEASYDHHAILISPAKNLIAFPADNSYLIYRYDRDKGFTNVTEVTTVYSDDRIAVPEGAPESYLRGLFINDYFYVLTPEAIASYQMPEFTTVASAYFDEL
ncbi:MAG: beta-propeller domain-containing protein [Actinomycetia bacterium]|nr:beta-propeller domain-containing protein [Actinomycetes bacterium]